MDQTQDQHPPMQGDDELAKALQGGLQFEETPVPGAGATAAATATTDAPTLTPAPATTDAMPVDPMNDPALLADLPDLTGTALPQPADDNAEPPSVHHTHAKGMVAPPATAATEPVATDSPAEPTEEPAESEPPKDSTTAKEEHQHAKKGSSDLDKLKNSALEELRPLVGKLNLPDDEKFDILLLIIRSTDDQALLNEAHDAAKKVSDDGKRAQALLDIIKEIDYFSTKR